MKLAFAIVIPHLYGYVANISGVCEIAAEHGVPVIEDAAQSIGARINGNRCGSLADFGVFSFHSHNVNTVVSQLQKPQQHKPHSNKKHTTAKTTQTQKPQSRKKHTTT